MKKFRSVMVEKIGNDLGFTIKKANIVLSGGDFYKAKEPLFNFLIDVAYSGLTKGELKVVLEILSKKVNKAIKDLDKKI